MNRILSTLVICLVISTAGFAQSNPPQTLQNEDLRIWLKSNWYDGYFSDLGYSGARIQMYGFVDEYNGQIECIYTGFQQASEFVTFPDPINAEHIIPQSFFGSATPMRSDIFNLRPCHGTANSARSNYPYGEVNDNQATWYGVNGSGDYFSTSSQPSGANNFSERYNNEWEPREEYKGDVARQIFYFYTMYPTQAGPISDVCDINEMYQWHLDDPVSAEEMERNSRIQTAQGNRNPYVLFEDLVYRAWFFVEMLGCTDPTATNFDPAANTDDGSCIFDVAGCTYSEALNYNPLATTDDGSCTFPSYVQGCTYPDATNFDPSATMDNGTCLFNLAGACPTDINADGVHDVADLVALLGEYGTPCD